MTLAREQDEGICASNPDLRIERSAEGVVTMRRRVYSRTAEQNVVVHCYLGLWSKQDGTGVAYDSSGGFDLPNGANRSPDDSLPVEGIWRPVK